MTPTVVLVHGAFAESSSWNEVAERLVDEGHHVIAYANPLRSVASDAAGLTALVGSIDGPVVLAGHSYGGAVMTNVPADAGEIVGLVYVAAFALEAGESAADAAGSVPGGTLADTLQAVPLSGGGVDLFIRQDAYHAQFCADLPERQAQLMAITQRPIAEAALGEGSGDAPLWRTAPSWFIFGDLDRNIPVGAHRNMAARAGSRRTVEIAGASHVVGVSHPAEVAELILEAAHAWSPAWSS
jgi:pimeloyl-ACP methyl ester carboxylesterase